MLTVEEIANAKYLPILREFEREWFPAQDVPKNIDFILWLEKNNYVIIREEDQL